MQRLFHSVWDSQEKRNVAIKVLVLLFFALLSVFCFSGLASSQDLHQNVLEYLDKKQEQALIITGTSTAASALLSFIPDDACTPIANQLSAFSTFMVLILGMLYLEEAGSTLLGFISFSILIPIGCISGIYGTLADKEKWKQFSKRIIVFALVLFLIIPVGINISRYIDSVNGNEHDRIIEYINDIKTQLSETIDSLTSDSSFWEKIGNTWNSLGTLGSMAFDLIKKFIGYAVQSIGIIFVNVIVIPLLTILGFALVVKMYFHLDYSVSDLAQKAFHHIAPKTWHRKIGHTHSDRSKS